MSFERPQVKEFWDDTKIIEESQYIDACVQYALASGWVQEGQKELLIQWYLQPIYRKYREVLDEVGEAVANDPAAQREMNNIIRKMGHILYRTRRIGATDPDNIAREIGDYVRDRCSSEDYLEYAASTLKDYIAELLHKDA